jgi:hypothetical protein
VTQKHPTKSCQTVSVANNCGYSPSARIRVAQTFRGFATMENKFPLAGEKKKIKLEGLRARTAMLGSKIPLAPPPRWLQNHPPTVPCHTAAAQEEGQSMKMQLNKHPQASWGQASCIMSHDCCLLLYTETSRGIPQNSNTKYQKHGLIFN